MFKRVFHSLVWALALAGAVASSGTAFAQAPWPAKPLRIIVPFQAGSFTDTAARKLAEQLTEQLGQPVIVEGRSGAGGVIGVDAVAKSAADGYTLLLTENSFSVLPALYPKLPYRAQQDLIPLTLVAEAPTVLWARPDFPAANVRALVDMAKAKPGTLTFGSGGQGSSSHLAAALFFDKARISVVHIPFKGVAGSINEAMAGRIDFGTSSLASPMAQIKSGRLRALAVTGAQRSPLLPDVPTFAESGFTDFDAPIWFGVFLPAGTPPAIVTRLHAEVARAVEKPALRDLFMAQGAKPQTMSSQEFTARINNEIRQWTDLVVRTGIKIE
ncbi:MAG: tripartite tricarboxylate transporter substrate binding protein [Pseudomonadota bacterium]